MAEFLEGLGDICRDLGKSEEIGAEVTDAVKKSMNDTIETVQKNNAGFLDKIQITSIDGNIEMKCGEKVVDRTKLKEAIDKNDVDGVFKELLKENSDVFNSEDYKEFKKNTDAEIKNSEVYKENKIQEVIENKKKAFDEKFGQIKTADDFEKAYYKNKSFKNYVDDIVKKSDEECTEKQNEGKNPERGSWTKTKAALFLAGAFVLGDLIKILVQHANEMSGCFLKDTSVKSEATKCKVQSLTCNDQDILECQNDDQCTLCGDPVTGCKDNNDKPVNCFDTSGSPTGTCIKYDEDKKTCSTYLPACGSDVCNNCTCNVQSCPPGKDLECKQANIGDAFVDYFNQFIDLATSILKKILYYGAIILIIGCVIFIIVKFVGWLMNRRKSAKVIAIST
jgi:hypothetical protein